VKPEKMKLSKAEVDYGPAKGDDRCGGCKHFEVLAPRHCEIVAGKIEPSYWCEKFEAKKD
jgi:hypothetical protein